MYGLFHLFLASREEKIGIDVADKHGLALCYFCRLCQIRGCINTDIRDAGFHHVLKDGVRISAYMEAETGFSLLKMLHNSLVVRKDEFPVHLWRDEAAGCGGF